MLEENHNLEKIIEDAKEYRWYSIPDMYMVEILDTTGRSAGYAKSIFIDKRRKTDEWHVGDVICYWNKPDNKNYGMIMAYECDEDIDANNLYCLVGIDRNAGDVEVYDSPSIEDLLKEINVYSHVEKVNAHLVVED